MSLGFPCLKSSKKPWVSQVIYCQEFCKGAEEELTVDYRFSGRRRGRGRPRHTILLRLRFARGGVVAGAGLNFVVLFGFDFQFAVAAVEFEIGRRITEVVLAAQFGGDLVE